LEKTGMISRTAMKRNLERIQKILAGIEEPSFSNVTIIATHWMRSAKNADEFAQLVYQATGLHIVTLTAKEEAYYSYVAVEDLIPQDLSAGVLDIGGGSTEFAITHSGENAVKRSMPIGAVSLSERFMQVPVVDDEVYKQMQQSIQRRINRYKIPQLPDRLVGVGGTVVTLGNIIYFDQITRIDELHGKVMTIDQIQDIIATLNDLTREELLAVPGLPADRIDIIVAGICILCTWMQFLHCHEVVISTRGVRFGFLFDQMAVQASINSIGNIFLPKKKG
jgi:exopolyphosphatase/guanosine-5'-triphosphate,3'-diphosphate pyrophosphatase